MLLWVYLARRLLLLLPILLGVTTILFAISLTTPTPERVIEFAGPASTASLGPDIPCAPPAGGHAGGCTNPAYVQAEATLGVGAPIPLQWALFEYHTFTGQWGYTWPFGHASESAGIRGLIPVATLVGWETAYTAQLLFVVGVLTLTGTAALGLTLVDGSERPTGRPARWMGYAGPSLSAIFMVAIWVWIPAFLASGAGSCGIGGFDSWYGSWPFPDCLPGGVDPAWLGPTGRTTPTGVPILDALIHGDYVMSIDAFRRLILPSLVLAAGIGSFMLRRWESRRDYRIERQAVTLLQRGMGLASSGGSGPRRLRLAVSPVAAELALGFGLVVGAIPIVESIFGLHGVGRLLADALTHPWDWGVAISSLFVLILLSIAGSLFWDALRAYVDPRTMIEPARLPAPR